MRPGTVSRMAVNVCHVFHDMHNVGWNELSVELLLEYDGKVQDGLHEIQKRGIAARNSCCLTFKLAQLNAVNFADCHPVLWINETNQAVLLNVMYVALHLQPFH